jgi:hypothetical protein
MSIRTIVLSVAILALAIFPATRCAADADDTAVDQLFSALRYHDFSAATAHFNHRMKAALSPAVLESAWKQTYADQGRLLSWKIIERQNLPGGDEVSVQLNFERSSAISTLAVAAQTGEIASLFFKLAKSNAPVTKPAYAEQSNISCRDPYPWLGTAGPQRDDRTQSSICGYREGTELARYRGASL